MPNYIEKIDDRASVVPL